MLEKQRRTNMYVMLVGALVALTGLMLYIFGTVALGISILVAGVVVFMLSVAVSNFFYRMDMDNLFKDKKK